MGIFKRKGFKYPEDLEKITCYYDATMMLKHLTLNQFWMFKHPTRHGIDYLKDVRLIWLERACHNMQRNALKSIYCSKQEKQEIITEIEAVNTDSGIVYYEHIIAKKTGRRVCGVPRKGYPEGWYCMQWAGAGTIHRGYGRCHLHEKALTVAGKSDFYQKMRAIKKIRSFNDITEAAESLSDHNKGLDSDIEYIGMAYQMTVNRIIKESESSKINDKDRAYISEANIRLLKDVATSAANIKKTKHFIESRGMIPVTQVKAIILQVLEKVVEGENAETQERIARRAMRLEGDLILPVMEENTDAIPDVKRGRKIFENIKDKVFEGADYDEVSPQEAKVNNQGVYSDEDMNGRA